MTHSEKGQRSYTVRVQRGTFTFGDPRQAVLARLNGVCRCGHQSRDHAYRGRLACIECETCQRFRRAV
jgi:hypothetical protein